MAESSVSSRNAPWGSTEADDEGAGFYFRLRQSAPFLRPVPSAPALPRNHARRDSPTSINQSDVPGFRYLDDSFNRTALSSIFASGGTTGSERRATIGFQRFGDHSRKPLLKPCSYSESPVRAATCYTTRSLRRLHPRPRHTPVTTYAMRAGGHLRFSTSGVLNGLKEDLQLPAVHRSHCAVDSGHEEMPPPASVPMRQRELGVYLDYISSGWGT